MHQWKTYFTDSLFFLFFLHTKNFPLLLFNPSPPYSTSAFKKDDVRLDCFVPSVHPGTDFYSHVSLRRGVYDQMVITLPCFHFLLWPSAFFLTLLEFNVTDPICVLKPRKIILKALKFSLTIISYMILWKKADYGACNYSKILEFCICTLRKPFRIFVCGYYVFWWLILIISTLLGLFTLVLLFVYSFLKTQIKLGLFGLGHWRIWCYQVGETTELVLSRDVTWNTWA